MLSRWWCPWILPVILLGTVVLLTRPLLGAAWLTICVLAGRGINAAVAELTGQTAAGHAPLPEIAPAARGRPARPAAVLNGPGHPPGRRYFKKPS